MEGIGEPETLKGNLQGFFAAGSMKKTVWSTALKTVSSRSHSVARGHYYDKQEISHPGLFA